MNTKVLPYNRSREQEHEIVLFYVERILDIFNEGCVALAHKIYNEYRDECKSILSKENVAYLKQKMEQPDDWSDEKQNTFVERIENARSFGEYQSVHDMCHEILLHHNHRADRCPTHEICYKIQDILARNNMHYLEPNEVNINTFLNASIEFVVDRRRSSSQDNKTLEGNPGFYLSDALGQRYRCFVKQVGHVEVGTEVKVKITNIPGPALNNGKKWEPIVYVEPRVSPGDLIEIELSSLSHTGNSFTFRHHSYDGFLWFKRRGVNKEIFNQNTLHPKDRILAKVLYTTDEMKRGSSGKVNRLGIIKAIPMKRLGEEQAREDDQDMSAARFLG